MSIFKESFSPNVRKQLETRQNAMIDRSPKNLQWLNSRNSWVRMSSSVNVDGSPALAKRYILQGGTLNFDGTLKSGIGNSFLNAYSTHNGSGEKYRLGIRPMPGITSIDVKNKGAYGSLLFTTVNYQCWDIKQLEDLELLYMRQGYTVLVEWGWAPYLDENEKLSSIIPVNNQLTDATEGKKEELFKSIKELAQKNGNYEAVLGYVKNFSWSARPDGGYDCTTEVVSLGEVLESLKVNYTPSENLTDITTNGLLVGKLKKEGGTSAASISDLDADEKKLLKDNYTQNILAGIFYELYRICYKQGTGDKGRSFSLTDDKSTYNVFHKTIEIKNKSNSKNVLDDQEQFYITLESLCNLLNNYVLLRDKVAKKPWVEISVIEANVTGSVDPVTGAGYLLALAHPLQLSIDPTVCLIKNEKWASSIKFTADTGGADPKTGEPVFKFRSNIPSGSIDTFVENLLSITVPTNDIDNKPALLEYVKTTVQTAGGDTNENIKEINRVLQERLKDRNKLVSQPSKELISKFDLKTTNNIKPPPSSTTLQDLLTARIYSNLDKDDVKKILGEKGYELADQTDPAGIAQAELKKAADETNKKTGEASESLKFLSEIDHPYFISDDTSSGLGIIGNIYVNIQMLYDLCLNKDLAAQDKKEKNDIGLYDFMKNILSKISNAIGNVNNFELFIEPNGAHARIIDINYVDRNSRKDVYENAFQLEVQNLKSTVRSYKLESKIFPEQSTQVAIAAQTGGGGGIGTDTTTMVGFNKKLTDRLIPEKDVPTSSTETNPQAKFDKIKSSISILYDFFADLKFGWGDSEFDLDKVSKYENALKDIIADITNLTNSKTGNRAILPTVFSVDLDGIGGMIIGNVFKINPDFLPRGYKGGNDVGAKLGYVVTNLGHKIGNGDWVTSLEGKTIILDDPEGPAADFSNITINLAATTEKTAVTTTPISTGANMGGATKVINGVVRKNGEIEDLLVPIRQDLYNRHWSPVCQSDKKRIRLQAKAMQNLEKMLIDAYAAGIYLKVNSAFRTKADQDRVFLDNCTNAAGTGKCLPRPGKKPAATPGNSNHGFGLAVDLANKDGVRINITEQTKTLKEWAWIQANKNKYGFKELNDTSESHHYNFIG
jgi:LAS superfamily LD-carboxypeptidase LdcB